MKLWCSINYDRSSVEYYTAFVDHVSLVSSCLLQFLRLSLYFMTLSIWGGLVRYFEECSSILVSLMFFLWLVWRYRLLGGIRQKWSAGFCLFVSISLLLDYTKALWDGEECLFHFGFLPSWLIKCFLDSQHSIHACQLNLKNT